MEKERKGYESQLNSGAEYVNSTKSGVVSYKVDGLEAVLKPTEECFSTLTKEYLESLDLKTGKIVPTSEESGKIIASYDDAYNLTSGTYELTLSNHGNVSVTLPEAKEFVVENQTTTLPELNCVEGDLNVALEKFNDSSTYNFNVDLFVLDVEEPDYSYVDHFVYANNVIKYTYGEEYYGADYIDYIETLEDGSKNYYSDICGS